MSQLSCTVEDLNVGYTSSFLLSLHYQVKLQKKRMTIIQTETAQIFLTAPFQMLVSGTVRSLTETLLAVQSGKIGQHEDGQQALQLSNTNHISTHLCFPAFLSTVSSGNCKMYSHSKLFIFKILKKTVQGLMHPLLRSELCTLFILPNYLLLTVLI